MNRKALFIIGGDPKSSPRPAEAIRIAAGVGTWKKVNVVVYLQGKAVAALSEYADEFVDEDNYTRYFPIVGGFGHPIYVEKDAPELKELGEPTLDYREITGAELAALAAEQDFVVRF